MIRLGFICVALSTVIGVSGCTDEDGSGNENGTVNEQEPIVNGMPASVFFAQFAWESSRSHLVGHLSFPAAASGANAASAQIFLMPSSRMELFYKEGVENGPITDFLPDTRKHRSGTWRIEGTDLVLDSFLRCQGLELNGAPETLVALGRSPGTPAANRPRSFIAA